MAIDKLFTKDQLDEALREKYHSGGFVKLRPMEMPRILDIEYKLPRHLVERMRVPACMLESVGPTTATEVLVRAEHARTHIQYVANEMPLRREPRTGDMELMIADIDAVEITPYSKFKGLLGRMMMQVLRDFEKRSVQQFFSNQRRP